MLKDLILNSSDLAKEPINVPQWPATHGKLFIREMNGEELTEYNEVVDGADSKKTLAEWVAVKVLVDENGNSVFSKDDIPALRKKNGMAFNFIFSKWLDLIKKNPNE